MQICCDRGAQDKHKAISNHSLQIINFISHDPLETQKQVPILVVHMKSPEIQGLTAEATFTRGGSSSLRTCDSLEIISNREHDRQ